ncbi:hypothetical protein [Microtetraspora glauca]|uniref:IS110 family transposase n=1 Tax=Microtetraspora glauca TaxID=1996 RepID=A0ABV3GTD4_MICGL
MPCAAWPTRYQALTAEIEDLDAHLAALVAQARPELLAVHGVGPETAAQLLITCGDNPDRLASSRPYGQRVEEAGEAGVEVGAAQRDGLVPVVGIMAAAAKGTAGGPYVAYSGISMDAAHVTGAAATSCVIRRRSCSSLSRHSFGRHVRRRTWSE